MSFFNELKRRNVIKVAIAYIVASWLVLQVGELAADSFGAPEWVMKMFFTLLALGFPFAIIFAWAFEMTGDGIKKEKRIGTGKSIASAKGPKLNYGIISLLVIALSYFAYDKFLGTLLPGPEKGPDTVSQQATAQITDNDDEKMYPAPFPPPANNNSIAVLPFANRSNSEDDVFFTDGIHDDLLTQLAKIGDLKVISRTSMMKYKDTEKTIPEIATELGVSNILEGGIQRAGKRIRINAQLIDVATDEHLWAETFDREMTMDNIFDIQTEITRQIVTAVKGQLTESEQQSLGSAPTSNLEAYEAYLQARAALNHPDYSPDKYIKAQPWVERAVKLDPDFAEAWVILADIHAHADWMGFDRSPENRIAADMALQRAVQLKPDSATVKMAQGGYLYRFDFDYAGALAVLNEAQKLAPGDAQILNAKGMSLRRLGLWEESVKDFEAALQLDPASESEVTSMIDTLTLMNEWDRVENLLGESIKKYPNSMDLKGVLVQAKIVNQGDLASARELFNLLQPWSSYVYLTAANKLHHYERNFDQFLTLLETAPFKERNQFGSNLDLKKAIAYYLMGDEQQSRKYFQQQIDQGLALGPSGLVVDTFQMQYRAICWSYLGNHDKALELSRKTLTMIPLEDDHIFGPMMARTYTLVLARAGNRDEALARLALSLDTPRGVTRWDMYLDPQWDFFRDDERFNELVRPLNLQEAGQ